jgi:4a-hydroxytetrahydrobiopterin dehydratase
MEPLPDSEITNRLEALGPRWRREGDALVADIECADFISAIGLVDRIAVAAEQADHHPDLLVHSYRQLRVTLTTHAASGITARDFALAAAIDAL